MDKKIFSVLDKKAFKNVVSSIKRLSELEYNLDDEDIIGFLMDQFGSKRDYVKKKICEFKRNKKNKKVIYIW